MSNLQVNVYTYHEDMGTGHQQSLDTLNPIDNTGADGETDTISDEDVSEYN